MERSTNEGEKNNLYTLRHTTCAPSVQIDRLEQGCGHNASGEACEGEECASAPIHRTSRSERFSTIHQNAAHDAPRMSPFVAPIISVLCLSGSDPSTRARLCLLFDATLVPSERTVDWVYLSAASAILLKKARSSRQDGNRTSQR